VRINPQNQELTRKSRGWNAAGKWLESVLRQINSGLRINGLIAMATCGVTAASAEELRPAPQYYLDTVIGMSLAEQYAWHCPAVVVNQDAVAAVYGALIQRLGADGFETDAPHEHMALPPQADTDAVITSMLSRNEAAADPEASFCGEARAEMKSGTVTGKLLAGTAQ